MAKEALFNILRNRYMFSRLTVLDLFSGTGNISYEFASRGSKTITAVDGNYNCVKFINTTAGHFDMDINAFKSDVFKYLERASGAQYDIVFADPPYDLSTEQVKKIAELVFDNNLLAKNGSLIIEHGRETDLSDGRNFREFRRYGGSVFSFFSPQGNDEEE